MSLLWYATFSRLGKKPSLASFPPRKGERPSLPSPHRGKRQRLVPGNTLPGAQLAGDPVAGIVPRLHPGNG
jgi:hypothetical protein